MEELKTMRTQGGELMAATDGEMKQQIGTSAFQLYLKDEADAVIKGRSAERVKYIRITSTREEFLAIL